MLIGFSKYGTGAASSAISYLTASHDTKGMARTPEPRVLRGDPDQIEHLIDSLPFVRKYTSGVLSFSESALPPETENMIMDEFEQTAFAGLEEDRRAMLWVKHGNAGRTELHFLTPRAELATGKSLNIAPPGKASRALFDTLRSKINLEHGFSDPDDPARARSVKLPSYLARIKARETRSGEASKQDVREAVTECLEAQAARGLIKSREDVLAMLRREGFSIPRAGKDYITIEDPTLGARVRLKGRLYTEGPFVKEAADNARDLPALEEKLRELTAARANYNAEGYRVSEPPDIESKSHPLNPIYDRTRTCSLAGAEGIGARVHEARATTERQCLAIDDAARELARGACAARDASERLGRTAPCLAETIECARIRQGQRELNQALIGKYGAPLTVPSRLPERGFDLEMERDLV